MEDVINQIRFILNELKTDVRPPKIINTSALPNPNSIREDIVGRLKARIKSSHWSNLLVEQLVLHFSQIGEQFGNEFYIFHGQSIIDTLECIESKQCIGHKLNRQEKLKGLIHAHHGSYANQYTVTRNVYEYWFDRGDNVHHHRKDELSKIIENYQSSGVATILKQMHSIAIRNRSINNSLKGEWIIYKEYNSTFYFLCLSTHNEAKNANSLYKNKIEVCKEQFPEIF